MTTQSRAANWPPRYLHIDGHPRRGQGPPRRFSAQTFLNALHGLDTLFAREVPADYWTEQAQVLLDLETDPSTTGRIAVISCTCGESVEVLENRLESCEGNCGRVFLFLGDRVRCANGSR